MATLKTRYNIAYAIPDNLNIGDGIVYKGQTYIIESKIFYCEADEIVYYSEID